MTVIVKRGKVHDGQREFCAGESIEGLSPEDEKSLVESGAAVWLDSEEVVNTSTEEEEELTPAADTDPVDEGNGDGDGGEGGPQTELPLTVEAFKELGSHEQKELLKFHEIEPASKEAERVTQYAEWLGQANANGV